MDANTFVLFGATGDLAKRKIYPALFNLFIDGKLPELFSVIGLGRRAWSDDTFKANIEQSLHSFSRREVKDPEAVKKFLGFFRYHVLDVDRTEDYQSLLQIIEQREQSLSLTPNRLFYLSVGPELFETIASHIQNSGLGDTTGWKRLVIEKPFGRDLQSARDFNEQLAKSFAEEEIFRIDHYLGKPMVQKLEVLQRTNPVIQASWNNRYIANVQITASETVGVEERAGYYDHSGALRDMFQNHMLQLLMMLAGHLPKSDDSEQVRLKKRHVMQSLEPLLPQNVSSQVIRGQYKQGAIQGNPVIGYKDEAGIPQDSQNETFIAAKLQIDDQFWRGIPFYIRTGKRMKEKATRIVIEFKEPIKQTGSTASAHTPNLLVFEISPNEGIYLRLNTEDAAQNQDLTKVLIGTHKSGSEVPEAYENLIYDALRGDSSFFAHWDEVELAWKWVQPIQEAFAANEVPLYEYEAGGFGPQAAHDLLAEDGFEWWFDQEHAEASSAPAQVSRQDKEPSLVK
ncbi:glucose-6-phosphate dehydrogenase [Paenibacillus senegalimassiliensis]|uniref:glucose-6-phosphate dehydrogenase n=1 Tax=Paenibacillus senegalimassiliensis TaxID=1737426 RepID=UPI00073F55F9|nr:glucose-6-phosphate dehydrogenase [Paenibacillus senegalimassiliensis]